MWKVYDNGVLIAEGSLEHCCEIVEDHCRGIELIPAEALTWVQVS